MKMGKTSSGIRKMREEYKAIRARSQATSPEAFDTKVKAALVTLGNKNPTPADFLDAAKIVRFRCQRCAGTGRFITGTLNGVPTGPGGICFRCGGSGSQDDADARRNFGADNHAIVRGVRAMLHGPATEPDTDRQEQDADDQAAADFERRSYGRRD
jgi:hypothetical protein